MIVEPLPQIASRHVVDHEGAAILRTEKLVKIYGGRAVVNGVDIELPPRAKSSACSARTARARPRAFT